MRPPTLRQKNVRGRLYWYTDSGGRGKSFGRVDQVGQEDAQEAFKEWCDLANQVEAAGRTPPIRLSDLVARFLDWLAKEGKSPKTQEGRRLHLAAFMKFMGGYSYCHLVRLADLEAFRQTFANPTYRRHHEVSIKACFRWGRLHGHLPDNFRPFDGLAVTPQEFKELDEADLPTEAEVNALLQYADADLTPKKAGPDGGFRWRKPEEYRLTHPHQGFKDVLLFMLETGCRTGELCAMTVGHWQHRSGTIILRQHKTKHKTGKGRVVLLSEKATEIVSRRCQGRAQVDPIFVRRDGKAWTVSCVADRLRAVKERAGVRPHLRAYSFRDLWASDALLAGEPIESIAKMLGTSTAMVEKVYGHMRSARLMEVHERVRESRRNRGINY